MKLIKKKNVTNNDTVYKRWKLTICICAMMVVVKILNLEEFSILRHTTRSWNSFSNSSNMD